MDNLFEKASRNKLRFKVTNGVISVEDLWDLKLEDLDKLAKNLNKQIKEASEESFIAKKTKASLELELAFEIIKHVISVRMQEDEEKKVRKAKEQKRAQIVELINKKENEKLEGKTVEELMADLEALG